MNSKRLFDPVVPLFLAVFVGFLGLSLAWAEEKNASDELSIAVLSFKNLSDISDHEYLDDILNEDIANTLGRSPRLLVITAKEETDPKDKAAIKQAAQNLEVDYALAASIDPSGERLTVSTELMDVANDQSLWSENYATEIGALFDIKDDITQQVVASLGIKPSADEQARMAQRATSSAEAYGRYLQARELLRHFDKDDNLEARKVSKEALALDPNFVLAHVNLAWTHLLEAGIFGGDQETATARARELAEKALAIDPSSVDALLLMGRIYRDMPGPEKDKQLEIYAKAVESNPNNANAAVFLGAGKTFSGSPDEGLPLIKRAIRLNPAHPAWYLWSLGWAQYLSGDYENAAASFETNLARNPKDAEGYGDLAHLYVKLGRLEDAKTAVTKLLELDNTYTVSRYGKQIGARIKEPSVVEAILDDLRQTGLQEE